MGNYTYAKQQPDGMKLYNVWNSMHVRCEQQKSPSFKYYGAKGIKVCDEWSGQYGFVSFYNWAVKNGYEFEPDKISRRNSVTIDRINPLGDYEPSNCRWVDYKVQANNRIVERKKEKEVKEVKHESILSGPLYAQLFTKCRLESQKDNNLKQIRNQRKLSVRALAAISGFDRSTISLWENNRKAMDDAVIGILCNVLDCSYRELMGRTVEEQYFFYTLLVKENLKKKGA